MATDTLPQTGAPMTVPAHSEAFDTLLCVDVHDETHDVKSFTFVSPAGMAFDFQAGQHLSLELEIEGFAESRCYSMSSSPKRRNAITVTVKRTQGGRVSNWLHDNLAAGATVKALGPLGAFVRPAAAPARLLLLSGGSGITPLMSIVRDLADSAESADVVFLHAGRTPRDLVFRDELAVLANRMKGLRLHFLPEQVAGERSWHGLTGRISREFLALAVPDLAERVIMCCGPAPFMKAARAISAELGVPDGNYHEESFDGALVEEPAAAAPTQTKVFKVEFAKQARSIEVAEGQTVLSCAKKAGLRLPSSCANGLCGTCKSKLVSGSVDMQHNGGIRQREIDAGLFLPCCSRPLSDLVIDR
jgi:glycine betaine catabolism B